VWRTACYSFSMRGLLIPLISALLVGCGGSDSSASVVTGKWESTDSSGAVLTLEVTQRGSSVTGTLTTTTGIASTIDGTVRRTNNIYSGSPETELTFTMIVTSPSCAGLEVTGGAIIGDDTPDKMVLSYGLEQGGVACGSSLLFCLAELSRR